ncbi:MAG: hypothetical protein QXW35_05765 [Candidatus Aenigmatarchaeota archaeon]
MQENFHFTAKSIATIFFAAKIYEALNRYAARKESYIIDECISLEDYLFNETNYETILYKQKQNLIVIDCFGDILNLSGSSYITESNVVTLTNKANITVRLDFDFDVTDLKQTANLVISAPQILEVTGQVTSKDLTIKQGLASNEIEVYDTHSKNLIARIKLIATNKVKNFTQTILKKIEKIFSNDAIRKPFAYVIGLISGLVILPVYSKIKHLFKFKQEDILYFETADDSINKNEAYKNELNKVNNLANKVITFISSFFKRAKEILKPFIQFIVALLTESKYIVQYLLLTIQKLFITLRGAFITFLVIVVYIFLELVIGISTIELAGIGLRKLGEKTKIQALIKFGRAMENIAGKIYLTLSSIIDKATGLNSKIARLIITFKQAKVKINHIVKKLEKFVNATENMETKEKLKNTTKAIIEITVELLKESITILASSGLFEKLNPKLYQRLSNTVYEFLSYLTNTIHTTKLLKDVLRKTGIHMKLNKEVNSLNDFVNMKISLYEKEKDKGIIYQIAVNELKKIRDKLAMLYVE